MAGTLGAQPDGTIVKIRENGVLTNFLAVQHGYQGAGSGVTLLLRESVGALVGWAGHQQDGYYSHPTKGLIDIYLNNTYLATIDPVIREKIPTVAITCSEPAVVNWYGQSKSITVNRKVFALSATEVGLIGTVVEGVVIPYFNDMGNNRRAADKIWWTRTPKPVSSTTPGTQAWYITTDGIGAVGAVGIACYVRPAFCLPSTLFVSDSGEIVENQPPSTPSYITTPERVRAGKLFAVSCGLSTDPDGDALQYVFEGNVNGAGYAQMYRGDSNEAEIMAEEAWNTVQMRAAAVDALGNYSAYVVSPTRTVDHNRDPVISAQGEDMGVITEPFAVPYSVIDPDGDALTITEALDGEVLRVIPDAEPDTEYTAVFDWRWPTLGNGAHVLTITAADSHGDSTTTAFDFTRNTTRIVVELKEPYATEQAIRQVLASVLRTGGVLTVEACNNGYDDEPTWEVITQAVLDGRKKLLANNAKTADVWGYNMRVTIDPSYAGEPLVLRSVTSSILGGAV